MTERLGLRYIDRIEGDAVERLTALVRPEVLGVLGAEWASRARTALSEILCEPSDGAERIRLRSGLVPARSTEDPARPGPNAPAIAAALGRGAGGSDASPAGRADERHPRASYARERTIARRLAPPITLR